MLISLPPLPNTNNIVANEFMREILHEANIPRDNFELVAAHVWSNIIPKAETLVVLGANTSKCFEPLKADIKNKPLEPHKLYNTFVVLINEFNSKRTYQVYNSILITESNDFAYWALCILILILFLLAGMLIYVLCTM